MKGFNRKGWGEGGQTAPSFYSFTAPGQTSQHDTGRQQTCEGHQTEQLKITRWRQCSTGRRRGRGLGSIKTPEVGSQDRRTTTTRKCTHSIDRYDLGVGFLTLSTCSRFSSLSWSWFLSHRAKSLSCVTAPRVSLSLAYSDFTCTDRSKERRQ